jgi:vitellogenic carboxypeptidase-like protein
MLFWLVLVFGTIGCEAWLSPYRKYPESGIEGANTGDPLFLTKYIEDGDLARGRDAARVKPLVEHVDSYAGFFTLNQTLDTNMFFWYVPNFRFISPCNTSSNPKLCLIRRKL